MSHFSTEPFCTALRRLIDHRHLSYRQLAYKTRLSAGYLNHLSRGQRPVPPDEVIERLARALHVPPAYFIEYRLRCIMRALDASPVLASALYGVLCQGPAPDGELLTLLRRLQRSAGARPPSFPRTSPQASPGDRSR